MRIPHRQRGWIVALAGLVIVPLAATLAKPPTLTGEPEVDSAQAQGNPRVRGLIRPRDRVAVVGSSSTRIGTWVRTLDFLLRTHYPTWKVEVRTFTTGGGTFETGLANLDAWLAEYRPSVVILNYGGNDAKAGREGLAGFISRMDACVAKIEATGARVILVTPQAADIRKSGREAASRRRLYAETMLEHARRLGLPVVDVHHPLEALQVNQQRRQSDYTILRDTIHLTHPAYVAWGYYFFDRLDLPYVRSEAVLNTNGEVTAAQNCMIRDVHREGETLSFTRVDQVLPILPPGKLPPREFTPLEAQSCYLLAVTGLPPGRYEIRCEQQPIGTVSEKELAFGVNLNTLLLDAGREAPWDGLARLLWDGKEAHRVGNTPWRFEIRPARPAATTQAQRSGGSAAH